jgi:hypothetical protein
MPRFAPPNGPYLALSDELCRCNFYHGSNMGRCLFCFNYFGDVQLANSLDWLARECPKRFANEATRILEVHGSCLQP